MLFFKKRVVKLGAVFKEDQILRYVSLSAISQKGEYQKQLKEAIKMMYYLRDRVTYLEPVERVEFEGIEEVEDYFSKLSEGALMLSSQMEATPVPKAVKVIQMGFEEDILQAVNEGSIETERQKQKKEELKAFLKKFNHNGIMKG